MYCNLPLFYTVLAILPCKIITLSLVQDATRASLHAFDLDLSDKSTGKTLFN